MIPDSHSIQPDTTLLKNDEAIECHDPDECRWGAIAHLSAMLPIPLFDLLGPYIVLATKGQDSFFVRRQAIEALNFRITALFAYIAAALLMLVLIGFILWPIIALGTVIVAIISAIKATEGRTFRFPFTIRLLQ